MRILCKRLRQRGFSLVELMIVLGATALFVGLLLDFGMNYWRYAALLGSDNETLVSRLNTQDYIREIIGTSDGLILQNSIPDANTNNPDPVAGASYWQTIHAVPATISIPATGTTSLLYFRRFSVDNNNSIIMNGTTAYDDEYILYVDNSSKELRVRILANPNAPNNKQKTTCPPNIASTSCPSDKVLLEDISAITSVYYSRSGNTINYNSVIDTDTGAYIGPDFTAVEALQYNFRISKKPLFQKSNATTSDTVVRIALRNM